MPELPEVEVTRRTIEPHLVGRTVRDVITTAPSYFFLTPPKTLKRKLQQRTTVTLSRRGKYLLLTLDDQSRVLLHLGMTGQLFTNEAESPRLLQKTAAAGLSPESQRDFRADSHTHLQLTFEGDGTRVFFRDVRKFGKVLWLPPGSSDPRLDKLGPDALSAEFEPFYLACQRRKAHVKTVLLNQSVLAGVGNIYADEALFLAGVRPTRAANRISRTAAAKLLSAIKQVLHRSIETGGSSISDYVSADGSDGGYQDERKVYGRESAACLICGEQIRRIVLGSRGCHYCPTCQK